MRILVFGSCNLDYVYSVPKIVVPGETVAATEVNLYPGGKGLNQAIALKRAGVDVSFAGCIGNDGAFLYDFLEENGICLEYVRRAECNTGQAFIQVSDSGENSIVIYRGANYKVTCEYVDEVLSHFSAGDVVVLQNEVSSLDYIVDSAYARRMKIALNPSPFDENVKKIPLEKISYLLVNEHEAGGYVCFDGEEGFIDSLRQRYPELTVALTLGSRGCVCFCGDDVIEHPSFEVDAVDSTAAGDTFTGYFISRICNDGSLESASRYACAAAAIAVSREGAAPSIPCLDEVNRRLPTMTLRESNRRDRLRNSVDKYFSQNINNPTLVGLASSLGYSPSYTARWLKSSLNTTFGALRIEYRLRLAESLLLTTDLTVTEIIERVGYKNETFFRREFKEKYGKAPLKYRKEKSK